MVLACRLGHEDLHSRTSILPCRYARMRKHLSNPELPVLELVWGLDDNLVVIR